MNINHEKYLYLDVCTLCRPFDDQNMMRIRLETDGYYLILQGIQNLKYKMIVSPVHIEEIKAISDFSEMNEVLAIMSIFGIKAECDLAATKIRATYLHSIKFGVADAAHIAFAEATSDFFITCDDKLIKKCRKENVRVTVMNPVKFCITEDLT